MLMMFLQLTNYMRLLILLNSLGGLHLPEIHAVMHGKGILPGANLDGNLGDGLGGFTSIQQLDLSNNRIEGEIPSSLPLSLLALFLSSNALTGSIPDSISGLSQLTAMSLNNNLLVGNIPDAFQTLTSLANLDLSSNSLNGELPTSLGNLLSLKSMHLQNNELSGTLDVLQDLPLTDLNIENNKFSGIIPDKMLSIPNFKKDGNLFDSGAPPIASPSSPTPDTSPSLRPPAPPFFKPPSSEQPPGKQAGGPPTPQQSNSEKSSKKSTTTKTVVSISVVAAFMFIIIVIAALLFMPRYCKKRQRIPRNSMVQVQSSNQMGKVQRGVVMPNDDDRRDPRRAAANPKRWNENMQNDQMAERQAQRDHEINRSRSGTIFLPPPPPPLLPPPSPPPAPPPPPVVKVVEPVLPTEVSAAEPSTIGKDVLLSVNSFTIASLQQYTNSFSQDNLIGTGMLGSVYRAELPDGKILAVKKLDKKNSRLKDEEFMQMVISIDKIQHANIVKLVGYCVEHGQWLLIYEYCSNGSVQEAIHSDDGLRLSWNIRVRMALEAAKALKYLHEDCHPPIIHRNFKSTNVLLDDGLAVRVSDCGLAPLITSGSVSQLSGQLQATYGYGAPEFESGIYTMKSDVYSFGVVILELLTGRKSYDRSRVRGEQFLVRWAIPQLHDIDALSRMVDPSLKGEYPAKCLSHFADIVARCIQHEPEFRPPMSEVVQDLLEMIQREPQRYKFN
uniref:Protein kinase domain-containing protein n=1 Tax=Kalanchoe fedtschenkoi TaxID=63787 RepID=A0A7N0ULT0_KALFE